MRDLSNMVPQDAIASVELLSQYDPENEKMIRDPYFVSIYIHLRWLMVRC